MVLICGDHNENARFTPSTLSRIYFPGSSNNSQWVCLYSDFNLRAPRSSWRTLMQWLNELTELLDAALQCNNHYLLSLDPPPQTVSPVINPAVFQRLPTKNPLLFFTPSDFGERPKVYIWRPTPSCDVSEQTPLWCETLYVSKRMQGWSLLLHCSAASTRWVFLSDAPSGHTVW